MDTTRIIEPVSSRLPSAGPIVATVTDVTSGLADHLSDLGDTVSDVDLGATMRRTRRVVAKFVPWMSVSRRPRIATRRWIVVGAAVGVIAVAVLLLKRRSTDSSTAAKRDDWTVGSANGTDPATTRPERETAPAGT